MPISETSHMTDVNYNDLYPTNMDDWEMYEENRDWNTGGLNQTNQILPLPGLDDLSSPTQLQPIDNAAVNDMPPVSNGKCSAGSALCVGEIYEIYFLCYAQDWQQLL